MIWLPMFLALAACLATVIITAVIERRGCDCPAHHKERY